MNIVWASMELLLYDNVALKRKFKGPHPSNLSIYIHRYNISITYKYELHAKKKKILVDKKYSDINIYQRECQMNGPIKIFNP